jgi:amino acid adenylation domain-containing protein
MGRPGASKSVDNLTSQVMTTTLDEINRLSPEKKRALLEQLLREKAGQPAGAPLSSGQERLWFLDRLEPDSSLYNIPTALRLAGDLNEQFLREALNEIVRRHEALRTTFASADGAPIQKINPAGDAPFTVIDLSRAVNGSRDAEVQRRIREAANQPFDLSRDLMIRATLLRLAPQEHILILVAHHIAADEWSLRVLFKELALLYEASVTGREINLPALPIQYADYANWQRDLLQGPAISEHVEYWRIQLEGCTPNLELPTDASRAAAGAHRGALAHHTVSAQTLDAIKNLSRRENATLFMTLLAAFNLLLHRYTRQEDILIGSPIAGRTRAEMEELIGFFVNTLVLRAKPRDDMPFTELLKQVRETTLGAYAHQELPFEKLVEMVHPERSASGSPLVQVLFAFESGYVDERLLPGLRAESMEVETGTAKFDLTLVAQEENGALKLIAEYDTDLFSSAMIERLLGHFDNLLKSLAAQPEMPLSKHEFLGDAEKKRLLVEWNNTQRQYPREASVSRLVEHWAASRPKSPAVTYGNTTLSYADLNARANQLARKLQQLGFKRGEVAGVLMERSNEMAVAILAILKAGGGYLPLDPSYPVERLSFMVNDSGARFLITQLETSTLIPNHSAQVITLDATFAAIAGEAKENLEFTPKALDLANLIYTSGSTGTPKGVKIPHRGIVRLVRDTDYMEVAPTDVVTQTSSISFDAATWEIWTGLINGAHLVGISKEELINPAAFREKLKEKKATIVFVTTAMFHQLASEAPGVFEGLKYVCFGGEVADPKAVASVLNDRPPRRLIHGYGPTETTVMATVHWVKDVPLNAATIPIGKPIANSTAYIVDNAGNLAPIGVPGELWLGGDGTALGYLNRPELTAERFVPDKFSGASDAKLYRSGDLARFREDGVIEFLGRIDTQVKVRGFRIELGEIEAALLKHPAVRKAAALAREDTPGEKRLVGYIETAPGKKIEMADLKTFLKQTLPEFMVPAAFIALEKMPLLPNGKVDRKSLPAPEWKSDSRVFESPSDALEQQIAKIWERVLNMQPIGATDNFFDLGGHSLLAVKLFAQFEKIFERKLPLATLFKAPTIRQLAEFIRGDTKPQAWSTIVDIQPKGTRRPIFWIHSLGGDGGGGFFYYRRLATLLGEDQPSFGIRSPQEPFDKIEGMAAYYVRALKEAQPQGPYQLGGFCFGGIVAYEMARQLQAAGDHVSLLAILESSPPNLDRVADHLPRSARFSIENVYENLRDFVSHPTSEQVAMVKRKARKVREKIVRRTARNGEAAPQPPPALKDLIDMSKYPKDYVKYAETHWKALESYLPGPYAGTIHLFRARKQPLRITDPSLGWNVVAPGRVKITVIPGTHESMVTDPNVQILADKIQETIRETSAAATS